MLLLVLLSLLANGCGQRESNNDSFAVTVAIEPLRPLVEAIAGDRVEVNTLMSEGTDPETYDPTIASLVSLESCDIYFAIGNMPFEDRIISMLDSHAGFKVVDVSLGVSLIQGTHDSLIAHSHGDDDDDECEYGHHHTYDPHTWSSVRNARVMARNIKDALVDLDPDGKDGYIERYNRLDSMLSYKDSIWAEKLMPVRGGAFAVWHPSLSYFARDYGLVQMAIGLEGKEMSVRDMIRAVDHADRSGVKVIISQPGYDMRPVPLSDESAGHICPLSFSPLSANWILSLDQITDSLAARL